MRPNDDLRVRIRIDRSCAFEAPVVDLSIERTIVEFAGEEAPLLAVAQETELQFEGGRLERPVSIRAWVTYRADRATGREFHFKLDRAHGSALQARLNRRRAFRVTPEPTQPVPMMLRTPSRDRRARGVLHDISESGLSVLVGTEDEGRMLDVRELLLSFVLPGGETDPEGRPQSLELVGVVRYRRLEGPAVFYGVEFDEGATADFPTQRRRIQDYVEARRDEMMQRVRGDVHPDAA